MKESSELNSLHCSLTTWHCTWVVSWFIEYAIEAIEVALAVCSKQQQMKERKREREEGKGGKTSGMRVYRPKHMCTTSVTEHIHR